ncbi:unnamed protein product, partial [Didymodactylos carnosus]
MNNVLEPCRHFSQVYLDDIIIFSKITEEHIIHVHEVLGKLSANNLKINPPKCSLARQQIDYLGHTITATSITPLNDKIKAILDLKEPRTLREANRFIGGISCPFQLQYGRAPRLPPDQAPPTVIFNKPCDYFYQLQKNLELYHKIARENIIRNQQLSKQRYDRNRRDPHYKVGDLVLTRYYG